MCGILGIASTKPIVNREWISVGSNLMSHRGPDDYGEWWSSDNRVGLAHRRLSIIEISNSGHQPMLNNDSTISLIFNGEIYNYLELRSELSFQGYIFNTYSDTEVVIAAYKIWGVECLERFNGMFALCIYDDIKKQVFIARDRVGEKPLFIHTSEFGIRFASELKALFADNNILKQINLQSLCSYLQFGYAPNEKSLVNGFRKLSPAHALIYDLNTNNIREWRYWNLPNLEIGLKPSSTIKKIKELSYELELLLNDSVRMQLNADVPVGVMLSGGLDSGLIAALAAKNSNKIKTFTVTFPGYSKYDESSFARLIADYYSTEHIELIAKPASAELLPLLAKQFDEPIADSSMIPTYLVSEEIKHHCSVALGGDGGDELFGGYPHYSRLLLLKSKLFLIPHFLRKLLADFAKKNLPLGFNGSNLRTYLMLLEKDFQNDVPNSQNLFDTFTIKKILSPYGQMLEELNLTNRYLGDVDKNIFKNLDIIQKATIVDFFNYLPEDILVKVDRASMLSSLEIRAPLLDYRIVEFAFSKVPSHLKVTNNTKKILLKEISKKLLPKEFDSSRKQGFSIPLKEWLKSGPFRNLFWSVLTDESSLFNKKYSLKLLKDQDNGRDNSERLFSLVLFELWRKEYGISSTIS
jgi:asparagine synthase (glutamine-hydrolysing)